MIRVITIATIVLATVFVLTGCQNPAADKPAARTTESGVDKLTVESRGESITFSEKNGELLFVGSKVTGSEAGGFNTFSGKIDLVERDPLKSQVSIEIATESVHSDSKGLAEHLKTPDFFDAKKYPKATFISSGIEKNGEKFDVTGEFDFHGVRKEIRFPASIDVSEGSITVRAEFSINRRDFNVNYAGRANDLIRDEVLLKFNLKITKD